MANNNKIYSNKFSIIFYYFAVYTLFLGVLMLLEQIYETNKSSIIFDVMEICAIFVCYLYFPVISIDYGRRAFIKNKRIFSPALILFLTVLCSLVLLAILFVIVAVVFKLDFLGSSLLDELFAAGYGTIIVTSFSLPISFIISIISSAVTKYVVTKNTNFPPKCEKNKNITQKPENEPTDQQE